MDAQASDRDTSAEQATTRPAERVGLLFVHGIGEQKRWEHLRSSVVEIGELLGAHCGCKSSISIIDRTGDWQRAPGRPDLGGPAPITLSLRDHGEGGRAVDFDCHEVWWADLGKRRGLMEAMRFWIWGLGQWGAPIYFELDASGLSLEQGAERRPVACMPRSVALEPRPQIGARRSLAWAAIGAALAAISISLFKRFAKLLAGATPSTTLIVDYVGDVQTYQERALPGNGPVSDPGQPWRVAIRRRMVSELVAMGARNYDRWYVLAHSLGTVVAFNGITEIGHTLPNYLPRELWDKLPSDLKRDDQCAKRRDIENMMPARPPWLVDEDCIDRPLLFEKMRGFVTYGSPLDKFAALWPRIVAAEKYGGTHADQGPQSKRVFPNAEWINILSLTDPVAGCIDRYEPGKMGLGANDLPHLVNVKRPRPQFFGLSHIEYFQVKDRCEKGDYKDYYDKFFGWLISGQVPRVASDGEGDKRPWGRFTAQVDEVTILFNQAWFAFLLIWGAASVVFGLALLAVVPDSWNLLDRQPDDKFFWDTVGRYAVYFGKAALTVFALSALGVYQCGAWRWLREELFNRRLARNDAKLPDAGESDTDRLSDFMRLALAQAVAAGIFLVAGPAAIVGVLLIAKLECDADLWIGILAAIAATAVMLMLAASVQSWLNQWWSKGKVQALPGAAPPAPGR